jgi:hypothetical protein
VVDKWRDQRGGIEICCFRFLVVGTSGWLAEVGKVVVMCGDGMIWRKNRKSRSEDGNLRGKII